MYDTRVIATQGERGGLQALAHRQEVTWRDGSSVTLHPVQANDLPMVTLRAVALPGGRLQVVDLERMCHKLGADLRSSPQRDQQGLVFFTLRHRWGSAVAFLIEANRHARGSWQPGTAGPVWVPAPRAVDAETLATADLATRMPAPMPAAAWCPR